MPTAMIKSTAKRAHRSVDRVEGYWEQAKKDARKKFKKKDEHYWAYVNAIVQKRSGLRESLSFKEFLDQGF